MDVQYFVGHADPRTKRIYNRRRRNVTRNIVERVAIRSGGRCYGAIPDTSFLRAYGGADTIVTLCRAITGGPLDFPTRLLYHTPKTSRLRLMTSWL